MVTAYNTHTSFLGIAKEATFGTPVAPTAFIPVTSFKPDDKVTWLEDKGFRGSMVENYGMVQGPVNSAYDYGGNVHLDTIGYPLSCILSDMTTTGTTTYTTKFSTLNSSTNGPSYTITDYSDAGGQAYPGQVCSDISFKFAGNSILTYDAKWVGVESVPAAKPTPAWTTATYPIVAGWNAVVKIGGTTVSTVVSGEFDIKQPVQEIQTIGSKSPYAEWTGLVSASGKLTVVTTDATYRTALLGGTSTSIDVVYTQGSYSLDLHSSQVVYKTVSLERSKDYLEWSIEFDCISNTTDIGASGGYSPVLVTLVNTSVGGTY